MQVQQKVLEFPLMALFHPENGIILHNFIHGAV